MKNKKLVFVLILIFIIIITFFCIPKSKKIKIGNNNSNQEIIQNFTDAIYKGQQWVKEHTANEIATNIQSFFPDTSIEMLTKAIQTYKDIDAWNETPVLKEEAFNRLQEVISLAGELQKKAPYEKIVNNSYALKSIEYNK